MKWENRATPMGLRLNKRIGSLHHEIGFNSGWGSITLEIEDTIKGLRVTYDPVTVNELLIRFPGLAEWETVLYAYEKVGEARKEVKELNKEIKEHLKTIQELRFEEV